MATVTLCGMFAAGLWGCGGAGGSDGGGGNSRDNYSSTPDGFTAISFTADGEAGFAVSHDLVALPDLGVLKNVGVMKDASATGTGTGTGVNGPTSIFDSVSVKCAFSFDTTTNVEAIQITNDEGNCVNHNECIICVAAGNNTPTCSLTCWGTVPSSTAVAADNFNVFLAFTSATVTDMPDPYGTVRHDATRTGTSFDLSNPSGNFAACTPNPGVNHVFGTNPIAGGTWFNSTASNYRSAVNITALDPDAGDNNRSHCTAVHTFSAGATLSGADTPGTAINNDLGTVTFKTKICDYKDDTPVAHGASLCTAP